MSQPLIERFKAAVLHAEQMRETAPLLALFAGNATCDSPAHEHPLAGPDGVELFWGEYVDAFESVTSAFTRETVAGDTAVLEWISKGILPTGKPVEYRGVSLVTFAGEKIERFVAYYDSAQFVVGPETTVGATTGAKTSVATGVTTATGFANDEGGD